jgi:DNA polymerase-3 subunit delta
VRLRPDQLKRSLEKGLASVYLLSGDEPLQIQECLDQLRAAARAEGFSERVVLHADARFDWSALRELGENLSLFAEKRLIDLRLGGTKPDKRGVEAIKAAVEQPNPDHLLLISARGMDKRSLSSAWVKAIDAAGAIVQVWPVDAKRLPGWVARRSKASGMELTAEACRLVAERSEGNLLACAQELDKIKLLYGERPVDVEDVLASTTDSSRFGAFDLVDCVLEGNTARAVRITMALKDEGHDPLQVLGPLAWMLRSAHAISVRLERGDSLNRILAGGKFAVWRRHQSALESALNRNGPEDWRRFILLAGAIDRLAKGTGERADWGVKRYRGEAWDALVELALAVCGVRLVPASHV